MFRKLAAAGAFLLASLSIAYAEPIKVGFIYVGPIGDHGWTYRHDIGRQQVEEAFGDKVETVYLESVKYGPEAEMAMRKMAQDGRKETLIPNGCRAGKLHTVDFSWKIRTL